MCAGLARFVKTIADYVVRVRRGFADDEDLWVVRGEPDARDGARLCARCLSPATRQRREASPSGKKTIVVPYCQTCFAALGQRDIEHLAWLLVCALLGVAACAFFPLIPRVDKWLVVGGALAFAAIPWVLGQLWLRRFDAALRRRSAASPSNGGIICTNEHWAHQLAEPLGNEVIHQRVRCQVITGWSITGLLVATIVTPVLYDTFHCETRILNLTDEEVVVWVDGHRVANVTPTSQENPLAGVVVRIAMGLRRLETRRNDRSLVRAETVHVAAGQTYLYAPAHPADTCFWVERTSLGRAHAAPEREYLLGPSDFWQMPISIDTWFIPAFGSESSFFTGGVVASLRQGSCASSRPDSGVTRGHF